MKAIKDILNKEHLLSHECKTNLKILVDNSFISFNGLVNGIITNSIEEHMNYWGYSILIPCLVEAMDKQLPMFHFYWHVNMPECTKGFLYKNIETGKVSIIYVGSLLELIYGKEACAMYDCEVIDRIYKKEKLCDELIKHMYSLGIADTYVENFLLV